MLRGVDRLLGERLVLRHRGQPARLFVLVGFVVAFLIEREEAVELHHLAAGAQVDDTATGFGGDIDGGAFEFRGFHLAGDGAIPDQLVQARLVAVDEFRHLVGRAVGVGRAHRFVRLLRVLRLVLIGARRARYIFLAEIYADHRADIGNRFRRYVDAVGAHIGDEAGGLAVDLDAFVETLRKTHGDGGRKAELAAGLLLHGRGGERRRRIASRRLGLNRGNGKRGGFERLL